MKRYGAILGGAVILATVVLSVGAWAVNQSAGAGDGGVLISSTKALGTVAPGKAGLVGNGDIAATAAATKTVCFFCQDGPATATILILHNTGNQAAEPVFTVQDFSDGTFKVYPVPLNPGGIVYICSDRTSAPGWNWRDFGTGDRILGDLELPPSVVVEGYIVWNGGNDTFDPGAAVARMPLRFLDYQSQ